MSILDYFFNDSGGLILIMHKDILGKFYRNGSGEYFYFFIFSPINVRISRP